MQRIRKTSTKDLQHYLEDARDLHGKFGNLGKVTLKKLLEPLNGSPNPSRIAEFNYFFDQLFITDLEEWICLLEDEIEYRQKV